MDVDLQTPAQFLKGVGPERAERLVKLNLKTAQDVLFFFPRDYQDLSELTPILELQSGEVARVEGIVTEVEAREIAGGRHMLGALIQQGDQHLRAMWFNQPFMMRRLVRDQRVVLVGTPKKRGFRWEMHHPKLEVLKEDQEATAGLQPVYRLTEGVSQFQMGRLVQRTVDDFADAVPEVFGEALREEYELLPIADALRLIHAPQSQADLQQARFRFVFQELFTMQLALALRHSSVAQATSPELPCDGKLDARITRLLPYALTAGQRGVIDEILADMARPRAMNRMLQGDVGSGKTLVAVYAMLVAIAGKHQAALMAPTEILARQHYQTFSQLLAHSQVRTALVTGSLSAAERRQTLEGIRTGEVDLIVGTQAVVQGKLEFHRLGLAVVDEGHRFGVQQRARLRQGETEPHYLVMTATPIPRSVSMTMFGDLDVSLLRELPAGRQPVHTYVGTPGQREQWWEFVRKKLREGRQAYVIAPLVEDQSEQELSSVEQLYETLCSEQLDEFRVDLLHGRMSAEHKADSMNRFRDGQTQVLVATSLVEVGVDVPNASVMTIENAERFGLAQLHQLRGRIGRGKHPGFICVYSPADSAESSQRLDAFASTTDGFELAEIDFRLRGPGDLFGTRQHGLPPLRIADLQQDIEILTQARQAARDWVARDPELCSSEIQDLRRRALLRYGKSLKLGDVG